MRKRAIRDWVLGLRMEIESGKWGKNWDRERLGEKY